jgi:phospholipid transport system substrate-binding protein
MRLQAASLIFAAGLLLTPLLSVADAAEMLTAEEPQAFIEQLRDVSVEQLTDKNVDVGERRARFQSLMNEGFDVEAVSSFVLAKYWRRASDEEKQSFQAVFVDVLTARFLPVFDFYEDGMTLAVDRVSQDSSSNQVHDVFTTLSRPKEEPVKIAWRLLDRDSALKIVDVRVENLSMAITLRSEYTSMLQRNGGSVAGLIDELKQSLAKGEVGDPALSQIN